MPDAEKVIAGYNQAVSQVRAKVESFANAVWLGAGAWRDSDIDRIVSVLVPRVQAGQIAIANLTSAYISSMALVVDGLSIPPVPVDRVSILGARGIDPDTVYRRPAVQMYTALSKGIEFPDALAQGTNRLKSLVETDLQLARTHQERASYKGSGYTYSIRTLTGAENCALCVIASTQRYHVTELRPIHPGCDCGSRQISANYDPGQVLDPDLLDSTHGLVETHLGESDAGGRAPDYRDLIVTHEHGEIGPVLAWRSDHFTGPEDLS